MKRTLLVAVMLVALLVSIGHTAPLRGPQGISPAVTAEAYNSLLSGVVTAGAGTAVDLGMTASKYACVLTLGGQIPTNVVVKLQGSIDNVYWYDMITHTYTPTEMVANGTFTGAATSWTEGAGWAYSGNTEPKSGAGVGALSQALASMTSGFLLGETYLLNYGVTFSVTTGGLTPSMCGVTGTNVVADGTATAQIFTCTAATGDLSFTPGNTALRAVLDNVSMVRGENGFLAVDKPARYIRGNYASKSGGGATTAVSLACMAGGQ